MTSSDFLFCSYIWENIVDSINWPNIFRPYILKCLVKTMVNALLPSLTLYLIFLLFTTLRMHISLKTFLEPSLATSLRQCHQQQGTRWRCKQHVAGESQKASTEMWQIQGQNHTSRTLNENIMHGTKTAKSLEKRRKEGQFLDFCILLYTFCTIVIHIFLYCFWRFLCRVLTTFCTVVFITVHV